jgi:GDP-L-fucose synthase
MEKDAKIYVAGHRGLVGSAIVRRLKEAGYNNLLLRTSQELNLIRQQDVHDFFRTEKPNYIFVAAAKVGGIIANRDAPIDFLYDNVMIEMNLMKAAAENRNEGGTEGTKKVLFLGSSCIFPKFAPQPIPESSLLSGYLEPTNEAYAIAKIAGLKLAEYYNRTAGMNFISAMPPNLYGPGDNFHPDHSHVIPGLIRRFHEAKLNGVQKVEVWGSGNPLREFLYVDDLADGCVFLMEKYDDAQFINIGSGNEITIADLARAIKKVVGYTGEIFFDSTKPDGTPRKVLDHSRIQKLGWSSKVPLLEGLSRTYQWYQASLASKA